MTKQIEKLLAAIETEMVNLEEHLETNDYLSFEIIGSIGAYIDLLKGELDDAKAYIDFLKGGLDDAKPM